MKGIKYLCAACFVSFMFGMANAAVSGDTTRTAVRRVSQSPAPVDAQNVTHRAVSRATNVSERTASPNVTTRTANTNVVRRPTTTVTTRTATSPVATTRTVSPGRSATPARTATPNRTARATTVTANIDKNYQNCRRVYYDCMDEFCANKDAQLKRCACSARYSEFNATKQQLTDVSDKMLDFQERLISVNMDAEDVAAMHTATAGEIASAQVDKSTSKRMLDEISKKLNTTFSTDSNAYSLAPISLSLNADSAFDNIDSLIGASATSKIGPALYSAATPICKDIAAEVCTENELEIAISGYPMMIEQDCNTVAKSYRSQIENTRNKIREGGALLDISRLNDYQTRNADDLLTCKTKMLKMLTDPSVCGADMGKCLDVSGKYINPTTGAAFLTVDLVELGNLISRPAPGETWTGTAGNAPFVAFLQGKKQYLESATKNCEGIADYVWDTFLEDALGQIKLAQGAKLENIRQSCTTLTSECSSNAMKSLTDFDARALSTFGVTADKTVNVMCADVKNACSALMADTENGTGEYDWGTGVTEITNDTTYAAILQTCREVGRACIIQTCKSVDGNFGLCESLTQSINRKSILNRTACWDEVYNCVASAGDDAIGAIINQLYQKGTYNLGTDYETSHFFYGNLYDGGNTFTKSNNTSCDSNNYSDCIYDICASQCDDTISGTANYYKGVNCGKCRIAERIWGNCDVAPATPLVDGDKQNMIKKPDYNFDTLLYWFATNTASANSSASCMDASCPSGTKPYLALDTGTIACYANSALHNTPGGDYCPIEYSIEITTDTYNCCATTARDTVGNTVGNCCNNATAANQDIISVFANYYTGGNICIDNSGNTANFVGSWTDNNITYNLFCLGPVGGSGTMNCDGTWVVIDNRGIYYQTPQNGLFDPATAHSYVSVMPAAGETCTYINGNWMSGSNACSLPPNKWIVEY